MKNQIVLVFIMFALVLGEIQIDNSSNIHFGTIHRVKDFSFIKVPFRLANYSNTIRYGNLDLNSKFALEFSIKDPIKESSFNLEVREMYLSWYFPFGQLNVGNIIHSWGILSNNSPTDNLSPINYYYIFSRGTERKIAQQSVSGDINFNLFGYHSLGITYIPEHNGAEIPYDDPELPIKVPLPENPIINPVDGHEYGIKYNYSGSLFDLELSYFDGYDKTMSSLGANIWKASNSPAGLESDKFTYIDTVLAYRKTEVLGLGFSTFINDLALKAEFAHFSTDDLVRQTGELNQGVWNPYPDIYREFAFSDEKIADMCEEAVNPSVCEPIYDQSAHMGTRAEYIQYILELEYPLFSDIQLSSQFIFHDLMNISIGLDGETREQKLNRAQVNINLLPEHNFIPGMGSPLTIFTLQEHPQEGTVQLIKSRSVYLNLKKFFLDYTLETNLRTFVDIINKGSFVELECIYDYNDSWKISSAINFITGNEDSGTNYPFNPMKDFSHFRIEFIYSL